MATAIQTIRSDVAVVIATLDRDEHLRATLRQLADQPTLPGRCIIIDQGPRKPKDEYLAPLVEVGVRCVYLFSQYRSISAARNVGLLHAGPASVILYLDDDIALDTDVVGEHARYYDEHPSTAAVAGHVIGPAGIRLPDDEHAFMPEGDWLRSARGCHMSFKAHVLREIGGFNAYICNNGDETELCRRLIKAGYRVRNGKRALIRHLVAGQGGNRQVGLRSHANYGRVLRDGLVRCVNDRGWVAGLLWPIKNWRTVAGLIRTKSSIPIGLRAAGYELASAYRLARLSQARRNFIPLSLHFADGAGVDPKTGLPTI